MVSDEWSGGLGSVEFGHFLKGLNPALDPALSPLQVSPPTDYAWDQVQD
jgi:hypothetical protein